MQLAIVIRHGCTPAFEGEAIDGSQSVAGERSRKGRGEFDMSSLKRSTGVQPRGSVRKGDAAAWCAASVVAIGAIVLAAQSGWSQVGTFPPDLPPPPGSLKTVPVPMPSNLDDFVADRKAATALGKALFWDQGAGSDGLACASCHFHAGADSRNKNQLDPGLRNVAGGAIS